MTKNFENCLIMLLYLICISLFNPRIASDLDEVIDELRKSNSCLCGGTSKKTSKDFSSGGLTSGTGP